MTIEIPPGTNGPNPSVGIADYRSGYEGAKRRKRVPSERGAGRGGGFTLIELLVVIVIIAIILGFIVAAADAAPPGRGGRHPGR